MRLNSLLLALLLAGASCCIAQTTEEPASESNWTWSPSGLMFYPLRAAVIEPRVGSMYQFGEDELRLDIGNSLDLASYRPSSALEVRTGADFFTYTRLRSQGRFKFPVETTDFYFGVNFTARYQYSRESNVLSGRLRVAHISSHLSDGYIGSRKSFVYSREFVDATAAYQMDALRIYAGANFLFSSIPDDFGIVAPQAGFDVSLPVSQVWTIVGGYDFRLPTIEGTTTGVHAAQVGIKAGERYGRGVVISGYGYSGKSLHGMFYDLSDSYVGIGFQVDL